ncbi:MULTISPECIES: DUF3408 domain-containing protein [Bacteroidota]|uniref:DUF3408 domain-containing protein n=1 Tax=Bacteroidota TaxID=976 RepID=UPI0006D893C9|nr:MULTISPECIES: DUF3408 domain-containing protein [Bacteroidota]KQC01369.1 conjugal transfer protein TraB [Pedobacter sp. Hv1]MDO5858374.1 DUF3408 domain-containing protein [Myroides odoratimimus]
MIHENDKKPQPEEQDFMEMIIGNDKKNPQQEQQTVTPRDDFTADEKSVETEDTKPTASNTKRTTSKPKKLTKEDYCGQFFKIPTTTASKGKSVYVRQEHHDTFNRLTNIMGIDKLTIYAYLDNIIEYHFQEFGELIKEIYNQKHKPLF